MSTLSLLKLALTYTKTMSPASVLGGIQLAVMPDEADETETESSADEQVRRVAPPVGFWNVPIGVVEPE